MAGVTTLGTSRESHRSLCQLDRKPDTAFPTREESGTARETRPDSPVETPEEPRDPCQHWRGTLRFRPQLQMSTSAPAAIAEESRETPCNSHGDWTFLRPHERVPEVPVVTQKEPQVCCRHSRKRRKFSPQREMRPFSKAVSPEKSHLHS